jgi:long-subunit fatty acid transport protein
MRKQIHVERALILGFSVMMSCFAPLHCAFATVDFALSPNPVGSGARAIGMGSAFIAVADDATAASWNPGGLVQLKTPEISVVGNWFHKDEDNQLRNHPELSGTQSVSEVDLNYLSVVYPFNLFDRNMVVSLNYQRLYDFTRELDFRLLDKTVYFETGTLLTIDEKSHYEASGGLSALGLAYSVQIIPQLSFGFTLNIWDNDLTDNEWEGKSHSTIISTFEVFGESFTESDVFEKREKYSLDGFDVNANIGMLWRPTDKLTIGGVLKTPFTADIKYELSELQVDLGGHPDTSTENRKYDMPMSYGIGLSYKVSDEFRVSADVYRTLWQNYTYKNLQGEKISAITEKYAYESDIDATHQVRIGMEYLFVNPESYYVIPLRAGLFYDPAPAEGSPDDYYGFSLGSGFNTGRWVFDIAYQYKFGNDVGASSVKLPGFSRDMDEHMVYSSLIVHF